MSRGFKNPLATWNERYRAASDMLFGQAPNAWLVAQAHHIAPRSRILCPGDGDGRNSMWLAAQGHTVSAFDLSDVAVSQAGQRALERGFSEERAPLGASAHSAAIRRFAHPSGGSLQFEICDAAAWSWPEAGFDAVVAIFIQFAPPPLRELIFSGTRHALRSGGVLIIEGYGPRQMEYRTGGPGVLDNLYTTQLLETTFAGWQTLASRDLDQDVEEGSAHRGRSHLISMVLRKP
jgi:SAM-dependent methyltransferase